MNANKKLFYDWLLGYLWSQNTGASIENLDIETAKKYKKQAEEIVKFIDRYGIAEWNENKN